MADGARTDIAASGRRHPAARNRSRVTNTPYRHVSGRTAAGRRVADLFFSLMDGLGNPTDTLIVADILRAAELRAVAEDMRGAMLAGKPIDTASLVRIENLSHRAGRRLSRHAPAKARTLADHIRNRA